MAQFQGLNQFKIYFILNPGSRVSNSNYAFIKCTILFAFFIFGFQTINAQNVFLDLYHPNNLGLKALITDSLFVRTEDATREIKYWISKSGQKLPHWQEIRKTENASKIIKTRAIFEDQGDRYTVVKEVSDSLKGGLQKEKITVFGLDIAYPDSIFTETWDSIIWKPVQKSVIAYSLDKRILSRQELTKNKGSIDWEPVSLTSYEYDGSKRLSLKTQSHWKDEWVKINTYTYYYKGNGAQPVGTVWYSGIDGALSPIDSTISWFNINGSIDSSSVFFWNVNNGNWRETTRQVFADDLQKSNSNGKNYAINDGGGSTILNTWEYSQGEQVYTDEPSQAVLKVYNAKTKNWTERKKIETYYVKLNDGIIYGNTKESGNLDSIPSWEETFFAEAWFHLDAGKPGFDSLSSRSDSISFSINCGFSNPYIPNQTVSFPTSEIQGDYELRILSEEGRMVYYQIYDTTGIGTVTTPLPPGLYFVSVSKGGKPLCTQKLVVQ